MFGTIDILSLAWAISLKQSWKGKLLFIKHNNIFGYEDLSCFIETLETSMLGWDLLGRHILCSYVQVYVLLYGLIKWKQKQPNTLIDL